ncbi:DNA binding protein SART-1 [Blastomyces gilchristii SLH14081]|uniref:DNA binding protein SART-1 n=2 Tax=Blastomyces TaxID=229219 RepID=A0A179UDU5_BLAGS|nr:DNA binding protein SART-1 [Blastomyces gilchristii SLH14081]EGE79475.1 DNA binding protein SART-1 [Blastomyces dermatitidis ATCC 18188]OAT06020.1 DNA binding protein SART-1 [Blastomyces gilchristii SLH14081]
MTDALSIEQNNKIRVALGLKPLPVPGAATTTDNRNNDGPVFKPSRDGNNSDSSDDEPASTLESRQAQGYDNWKKYQDEAEAKKKRQEKLDAIKRARENAQKLVKLEGKGLGEVDEAEAALDTKTWLMQQKKRQRKIEKERAKRLAEELAERERIAEYTAKDLAGVRVGHEVADFEEGEEQILTLKDTTIDENEEEGDELENIDLRDRERLNERLALKKKKPVYDPNDFDGSGSILAQYDEEIEGKKRKRFTLDAKDLTEEEREAKRQDVSSKLKAQPVNLDIMPEPTATPSDYQEATEIKIKKPKKKKPKSTRQKAVDEDDIFPTIDTTDTPNGDSMEVDSGAVSTGLSTPAPRRSDREISFVDDEDLQASLATQRRAAFKKRKKVRPEDIARQLREESEQAQNGMDLDNADGEDDAPGLVIDETSEFVANLQRPTIPDRRQRSVSRPKEESPEVKEERDEDVDMERSYNDIEDEEDLKGRLKRSEETTPAADITATGLEEESTLDQGLGSTLAMLKQRGLVKESNAGDLNTLHRERQRFLQEKQRREAEAERRARLQRERDRASGKLDRMTARDREEYARQENKQRDQLESRQMAEIFNREYKPDVQLKYVDEHGRLMDQKEAFKHLSHQFHGKGSGKMKTEKHLKKIEEEKKREAMSTLDSSQHTGMNNAMGATARRNRQAGVRLG